MQTVPGIPVAKPFVEWQWKRFAELESSEVYAVLAARSAVFVVEQRCHF